MTDIDILINGIDENHQYVLESILKCSTSVVELLHRQKIRKEVLIKYLETNRVIRSQNLLKTELVKDVLDLWENKAQEKQYEGQCTSATDTVMDKFNASTPHVKRMWKEDIKGCEAYIKVIQKVGLVTEDECDSILSGLKKVASEWDQGKFEIKETDEDIHTANERRLKELIDVTANKLYTSRSRNDLVGTSMRLWMKNALLELGTELKKFLTVIISRAREEKDILMPDYRDLQRAQQIRWSNWLLSYGWMLKKDYMRMQELQTRASSLTLGSGALDGPHSSSIDRKVLAKEFGFMEVSGNILDSVRDFIAEFLFLASMLGTHLSRWANDLILYSSKEFGFVITLVDANSTGSSLMHQKNTDSLELIRGKAGRIFGYCPGFMMTIKGVSSANNKDLQEDKKAMFDVYDTLLDVIKVATGVLSTLQIDGNKMEQALSPDMLAIAIDHYLVKKGIQFQEAHKLSEKCIKLAEENQCPLSGLSLQDFKSVSEKFTEDILSIINYEVSMDQYNVYGGTGKESVTAQIENLESWLQE